MAVPRGAFSQMVLSAWQTGGAIDVLPGGIAPRSLAEAHAMQQQLSGAFGPTVGWKIAATSVAGQAHIGVDGPLAGRLFRDRQRAADRPITLAGNRMLVAEPEFAFTFRASPNMVDGTVEHAALLDAVESLHLAIEIPNSRFRDFVTVGLLPLVADNACAHDFVVGPAVEQDWRRVDLVTHAVKISNARASHTGSGRNVLGDPIRALQWLIEELARLGCPIEAGMVVITGTAAAPLPIAPSDTVVADFGELGQLSVSFKD